MSIRDRQHWDGVYQGRAGQPMPAPDPLLLTATPPVSATGEPPVALDLACGMGQNGLWLAEQGYVVDLIDISRAALRRAQAEAAARRLRQINLLQADLDEITPERERYDLVCVFRFFDPRLMPAIRAAVKPGGRIIYETFNVHHLQTRPDFNPAYLLHPGDLFGYFGDWRVLHSGESGEMSHLVAIKPEQRA
jgi:SAM-dependent methyltransferase